MDNKQIIIVNLSKGKIGEDKANLLGSLIVSSLQVESMKRSYFPESERVPFFTYLDEFQNFGTEAFVSILSESRKYAFSLCIAHQYTKQISESVKSAVIGNVGTIVLFSISSTDAEIFATEFTTFPADVLVRLGLGETVIRQYKHGKNQEPQKVKCFAPVDLEYGLKDKIIKHSKMRFCKDRKFIEYKIRRFYGQYL